MRIAFALALILLSDLILSGLLVGVFGPPTVLTFALIGFFSVPLAGALLTGAAYASGPGAALVIGVGAGHIVIALLSISHDQMAFPPRGRAGPIFYPWLLTWILNLLIVGLAAIVGRIVRGQEISLSGAEVRRGRFCEACQYDLTGNVSGICPECGTPIPGRKQGT